MIKREEVLKDAPSTRVLALGNEAIAQLAPGYPGTPSTGIMEAFIEAACQLGVAYDHAQDAVGRLGLRRQERL